MEPDSLEKYVNQRFADLEKLLKQEISATEKALGLALTAAEKAVVKAEEAASERMSTHNRLQEKLDLQGQQMAPKIWVEDKLQSLSDTARVLEKRVDRIDERKIGMTLSVKIAVGIVAFAATLVGGAVSTLGLYFLVVKFMARSVGVTVP